MPRNRIMNISITENDLKFNISCLKQLERILTPKAEELENEELGERIFRLRNLTAILERAILKQ